MKCNLKRSIFTLFEVFNCENCKYKQNDEFIYIGRNVIGIYYLFDDCLNLEMDKELLIGDSSKLKLLLRDAIINQEEIFLCLLEDFKLSFYYDEFEKILDAGLSVQIITL